jgi:hypothetical protein
MPKNKNNEPIEGKIRQAVAAVAVAMFDDYTKADRAEILGEVDLGTIENVIAGQLALAASVLEQDDDIEGEDEGDDDEEGDDE